jgi:hypothetical protein
MPNATYRTGIQIVIKQTEQPTDAFELQAQEDTFNSAPAYMTQGEVLTISKKKSLL